ncbi:MAG: phytoene desaturase family protein, partial [Acidimicrobiales bacterium]
MRGAEVIVVGAGHNGLICAAYLARAGVDTVVVESRDDVGGVTSTVSAMGSRFNVCNCDHSLIRAMPIIDELDLGSHGLEYLAPEVGLVNMFHDRAQPWLMFHDTDRTLDALAVTYPRQVEPYRRYLRDALPVAELVLEIARVPPGARSILEAGLVAGRGRAAARLLAWSRRSATDVLSRYFDDWHMSMPAISTGPTMWGASPDDRGTGLAAIGHAMRHVVRSGRPRGGSGALTHAIRGSFEAAGGRVRCASAVDRLLVSGGRARGVGLTDGTELTASVVVSACDPRAVLVDWIREPPPAARRLARRWRR